MDHSPKVKAALAVVAFVAWLLVGCLASSVAHAIGAVSGGTSTVPAWYGSGLPHQPYASYDAACHDRTDLGTGGANGVVEFVDDPNSVRCYLGQNGAPMNGTSVALFTSGTMTVAGGCPANATASGSSCSCNAGFRPTVFDGTGTTCQAYSCAAGAVVGESRSFYPAGTTPPGPGGGFYCPTNATAAVQGTYGCSATVRPSISGTDSTGTYVWGTIVYNGGTCNGGETGTPSVPHEPTSSSTPASGVEVSGALPQTPATTCAAGTCPGIFNGASICVACSSVTSVDNSKTVTAPSGTASAPSGTYPGTLSSTTTCTNGVCQSIGITTDPGGNQVVVSTGAAMPQSQFCAQNPRNAQCQGAAGAGTGASGAAASTFGGTCAATTCSGDAIVCAIAQEQAKRDCQLALSFGDGTTNTLTDKGVNMAAQGDAGDTDHPHRAGNIPTTDFAGGFDQTDLLSHASCVPDRTIGPIVLPLSKLCAPADIAGLALLGITSIACLMIVFGRGKV